MEGGDSSKKSNEVDHEKTPDRIPTEHRTERRSSHLLASAGIDIERRRKSHQHNDTRIFQEGKDFLMEGKDGKITKLEVLEINEKMGKMRMAVPSLPLCLAIFLCFLNTFLPGVGTLICAASLLCCGKCRHENTFTGIKYGVLAGILQIVTTIIIVGWIYSIIYGVYMIQDSITQTSVSPQAPSQQQEEIAVVVDKPAPPDPVPTVTPPSDDSTKQNQL